MKLSKPSDLNFSVKDLFKDIHNGNIILRNNGLTKLPTDLPTEVVGYFDCVWNELTSLEGCPDKITGDFWVENNKLKTLTGCPTVVGGDFYISNNPTIFKESDIRKICKVGGHVFC